MTLSRRSFMNSAVAAAMLASLLPPEQAAALGLANRQEPSPEEAPDDAYGFWTGFYDSVNPEKGMRGRAVGDALASSDLETQYLNYREKERRLHWATDIGRDDLLDHDGDVAVSISLSQFRPGTGQQNVQASQLRVDAAQTSPMMNLFSPLAWTAIASLNPNGAGKIPNLQDLGFHSDQAMSATSHILLTQGSGKMAVNISRAPNDSAFLKVLKVMIVGAKAIAPLVTLPAVSVPALSTFTEAFAYWENKTRFVMNGNLVRAVATQQALEDPKGEAGYIGLVSGDYVMVPRKHTDDLAKALPDLDLEQGYLVAKNANMDQPLETRANSVLPGITYASMRVAVEPVNTQGGAAKKDAEGEGGASSGGKKKGSSKKPGGKTP